MRFFCRHDCKITVASEMEPSSRPLLPFISLSAQWSVLSVLSLVKQKRHGVGECTADLLGSLKIVRMFRLLFRKPASGCQVCVHRNVGRVLTGQVACRDCEVLCPDEILKAQSVHRCWSRRPLQIFILSVLAADLSAAGDNCNMKAYESY